MKKVIIIFLVLSGFTIYQTKAQTGTNYIYDDLNRLTQVTYSNGTTINYTYDALGNRLSKTVTAPIPSQPPTVTTANVSQVSEITAICGGNVTSDGGDPVYERGVCWSTSHNPTTANAHLSNGSGTGSFTINVTGLSPNTTYYVRAYASNNVGTSYGEEKSFTTIDMFTSLLPYTTNFYNDNSWYLNNGACSNYWTKNATLGLFVTNDNTTAGYDINSSSVVMAEKLLMMPSSDSIHLEFDVRVGGESSFDYLKVFLSPSSVDYVPSTSHNAQSDKSYSTYAVDFSDFKSQTGNSSYPYMLNLTNGNGTVHISLNVENPNANWTAKLVFLWRNDSSLGEQPGAIISSLSVSEVSEPVIPPSLPTVATNNVNNITSSSASCGGNVTSDGGDPVYERGVCWSTSHYPTTSNPHTTDGTGTGGFTSSITGLTPNTTYFVRAYATNSAGTAYGNEVSVITACGDVIVTISGNSSVNYGQSVTLTAFGASTYIWSIGQTGSSITVTPSATTTYSVTGTDVNGCTGIATKTVTVIPQLAVVTTTNATQVSTTSALCGGNISSDGGSSVTARGVCWSTSPNPTTSDSHTMDGTSTGSFTSSITGLTPNTTYYVRAYAINLAGTAYGNELSFHTSCNQAIEIAGTTNICQGQSTTLTACCGASFNWNTGTHTASISVSPSQTTTYTVTVTDAYGCQNSTSTTIIVNPLPVITCSLPTHLCWNSDPVVLNDYASVTNNPNAQLTFSGYGVNEGIFYPSSNNSGAPIFITVSYQDPTTGCWANSVVDTITVHLSTSTTLNNPTIDTVCQNELPVQLSESLPEGGFYSGLYVDSETSTFNPPENSHGEYLIYYEYTDQYGCHSLVHWILTVIPTTSLALYTNSIMYNDQLYVVYAYPDGGTLTIDEQPIPHFADQPTAYPINPSDYSLGIHELTYTFNDYCHSSISQQITITTSDFVEDIDGISVSIRPNPTTNKTIVSWDNAEADKLCLYDVTGKLITTQKDLHGQSAELDLSPYANGVYFVRIHWDDGRWSNTYKIVKE